MLDTSACIALTDQEPGADRVRELVLAAGAGEINLHGCFVTLTEVQEALPFKATPAAAK